jgi:ATP-binding protein involved in chromosome partitioning
VADPSGAIPLVPTVSSGGDAGRPVMVQSSSQGDDVRQVMRTVGEGVWSWLASRPESTAGMRG